MKKIFKIIILISFIIYLLVELLVILLICTSSGKIFIFKFDLVNGWDTFITAFNIPLQILKYYAIALGILYTTYKIINFKSNDNIFTKEQKQLIKEINNRKIIDFETLIIRFLKPKIKPLGILYKINGMEFKPDDKVFIFVDPRDTYLKMKSMSNVIYFLITNKAIELITKYNKIDNNKTLNPFYIFTKPPTEQKYFWDKRLNDILYKNFKITNFDKEIRPIENRLRQYMK